MVIVSKELLLSSLFTTIANLNDIAECSYWIEANDSLYGRASLRNTEGFITCLDEIQSFSVYEDSIVSSYFKKITSPACRL